MEDIMERRFGNRDGGQRFGGGFNREQREMHDAVCAKCKKECKVPFKPSKDRPVYCRECFQKKREEEEQ